MLKRAHWPILMLTLALAGCGGGGGGGGTPAPTPGTGGTSNSNVTTIAPGAGTASSTSTSASSGGTSSGSTTATGQPINVSGFSYPQGLAVSGSTLYVANTNGQSISVITLTPPNYPKTSFSLNYATGALPLTQPTGLVVSNQGTTLYVANWSSAGSSGGQTGPGFIDAVDIATGNVTLLAKGLNNPDGLALSADGNSLFVANHGSNDVLQISTTGGTTIATYSYPASSAIYPWSVYADSSYVYATNSNGTVSKWAIVSSGTSSSPTTVTTLASPAGITGANDVLYIANYSAQTISKVDPTSGTILATVSVAGYQPNMLAHDATRLYFTDSNSGSVNAIPLP
ncbi:MAG: hypothetical protein KGJ74_07975 [Betaproteobacteria bacterium]|nr:hypothetical protein [Betaproteobacteria bacterium]